MAYSDAYIPGGGTRKLAKKSNVWFYPRIRVVPQSEYSYWGISDSDCVVFDTYFFSNSTWTNTGVVDGDLVTSATQLPKKVFFKEGTSGTAEEAYAVGYNPGASGDNVWYQATWIKPIIVKCTTTKGYITAINCDIARFNTQWYYMGIHPSNPIKWEEQDNFLPDQETSETLKWHNVNSYADGEDALGDFNDSYYYFDRYKNSTGWTPVTYFLRKSINNIYNYRKFYFIVPVGCQINFGIEALDFLAYNGWDGTSARNFHLCKDYNEDSPIVRGFFNGNNLTYVSSSSVTAGNFISSKMTYLGSGNSDSKSGESNHTSFYVSGETSGGYGWNAALTNPLCLVNLNTSTGTLSGIRTGNGRIEVCEDNNLYVPSSNSNGLYSCISGLTINFGAPQLQYMYAGGKLTKSNTYYAYLNKNCVSVNGCTLAYSKSSTTGMDGTTLTWNSVSQTTSTNTISRQWTISNQHDSSGIYVTKYYIRDANASSDYKLVATDSSVTIGAFNSASNSYSRSLSISPYYKIIVYCTYISETNISCELNNPYTLTDSRKIVAIEATYDSSQYSCAYVYYNNGSSSATVYKTNNSLPSTYSSAQWYVGPVTKVTATPKTYYHTCRWATRSVVKYRIATGSWSTAYGDWTYGSYSSSSDYCYHKDVEKSITITRSTNGGRYQYWFSDESFYINPPTIKSCTDGVDWKRIITVYNPNPVSLTVGYSGNKSSYNYRPNSQWYHTSISPYSTITLTIYDQGGFSDEWIIVGFKVYDTGSEYGWVCTTIDEDPVSGTPSTVKNDFYYNEPYDDD